MGNEMKDRRGATRRRSDVNNKCRPFPIRESKQSEGKRDKEKSFLSNMLPSFFFFFFRGKTKPAVTVTAGGWGNAVGAMATAPTEKAGPDEREKREEHLSLSLLSKLFGCMSDTGTGDQTKSYTSGGSLGSYAADLPQDSFIVNGASKIQQQPAGQARRG